MFDSRSFDQRSFDNKSWFFSVIAALGRVKRGVIFVTKIISDSYITKKPK